MLGVVGCLAVFVVGDLIEDRGTMIGVVVAPLLIAIALPILARIGRRETAFDLTNLMLLSLALHLTGAYFRLYGAADSSVYHRVGSQLAEQFRQFDFTPDIGRAVIGTGFIRYLSGLVQLVTFDNRFATFLVFAFGAFWGIVLLYRAFVIAFPGGDRYRYAKLIFLWPSLIFWPSSIGKEAWMLLGIGIVALGTARVMSHQPRGLTYLAIGLLACSMVRPHVAMLLLGAFIVAYLLRSASHDPLRLAGKIVAVVVLLVATSLLATQTTDFFDLESLGADSLDQVAETTTTQTVQGGSAFAPARVRSPLDYPVAAATVILRPFPFEADSTEMLLTSLEALLLLALAVASIPRYRQLPRLMRNHPYLIFSAAYVLTFVWAFSTIGNFGILARQRTQVLPFLFVFLALPAVARRKDRARPGRDDLVTASAEDGAEVSQAPLASP